MLQSVLFILVASTAGWIAYRGFSRVRRNILLGKDEAIQDHPGLRWKNMLLVAFGQQKMFQNWIPALLHLALYVAFVITQIELIEMFCSKRKC